MLDPVRWKTRSGEILAARPAAGGEVPPGVLRIIDQTLLPGRLVYLDLERAEDIADAIRRLAVRGAPAIGCAAALGLAAAMQTVRSGGADYLRSLRERAARLEATRPTAVNLAWALRRCTAVIGAAIGDAPDSNAEELNARLRAEALDILEEDIRMCRAIGEHGLPFLHAGARVLTHCNAGALATGDYGTATAPLYRAHEKGWKLSVYAGETRPLLQGARLTAWELGRAGLDVTVLCDGAAPALMREQGVDLVITGADRIAADGTVANKIGTYGLALAAQHHGIPFYVAAPYSTFDPDLEDGEAIPIEQRGAEEVTRCGGFAVAPENAGVWNPAFDLTPAGLIRAWITDRGTARNPKELKTLCSDHE
ncbi:S-methyl-5-thioribose-1-phosphate isomerase [Kiritimatiella glycovorans]|uniref:Methylthioribose-1-phosphate isomerase n=1 Tax=Kiritimatiella glycovorans TaxID=1307763 RepID=A0A0G3EGU3_9BACT|nr:S-methyl-5-thioribose-1-phosphate isomerase [Kiritimatiella glycovorans]AKJ65573.1 Methylthioribose-1-phosphate isomerase [Kiritimatiella glycovorans]